MMKVILIFGLALVAVQAFELSDKGKKCVTEIGTDETTIKDMIEKKDMDNMNDMVKNFMACVFRDYVKDDMTMDMSEEMFHYMTTVAERATGEKTKVAKLLAKEMAYTCKDRKAETKDDTAMNMMMCMMRVMFNWMKEE